MLHTRLWLTTQGNRIWTKKLQLHINNLFVSYLDSFSFFIIALDVSPKARNQLLEKIIPAWQWLITALLACKDLMGNNILISFFWLYYSFFFFQMVYKMNFLSCLQSVFHLCRKFWRYKFCNIRLIIITPHLMAEWKY